MEDYSASITVAVPAEKAYRAITGEMSDWWSTMSGRFLAVGDRASVSFGARKVWGFEATALDAPHSIELLCIEADHVHEGLPDEISDEWLDSVLRFDIAEVNGMTEITLTHRGLNREMKCYDICEQGWDHYFGKCLKEYLGQ